MVLGQQIRKLRSNKKMTLRELSERVGISISFLSDIENGRSNPSLEKLEAIAKGLSVPVSYLLGEDNVKMSKLIRESCEDPYTACSFLQDNFVTEINKMDSEVISFFLELAPLSKEEQESLKIFLLGLSARRKLYGMDKCKK